MLGKCRIKTASFCLFLCLFIIKTGSHVIALAGLGFTEILLPLPLECWGYIYVLPWSSWFCWFVCAWCCLSPCVLVWQGWRWVSSSVAFCLSSLASARICSPHPPGWATAIDRNSSLHFCSKHFSHGAHSPALERKVRLRVEGRLFRSKGEVLWRKRPCLGFWWE